MRDLKDFLFLWNGSIYYSSLRTIAVGQKAALKVLTGGVTYQKMTGNSTEHDFARNHTPMVYAGPD